jgi:hypothetical protein
MTARYVIVHTDEHGLIETLATVVYTDRAEADHRVAERRRTATGHDWSDRYDVYQLLPADVEQRVEWKVRWLTEGGGIATSERHLISRGEAERLGPTRVGEYNIAGWSVHHRTHRSYTDGSSWTGPWYDVEGEAQR